MAATIEVKTEASNPPLTESQIAEWLEDTDIGHSWYRKQINRAYLIDAVLSICMLVSIYVLYYYTYYYHVDSTILICIMLTIWTFARMAYACAIKDLDIQTQRISALIVLMFEPIWLTIPFIYGINIIVIPIVPICSTLIIRLLLWSTLAPTIVTKLLIWCPGIVTNIRPSAEQQTIVINVVQPHNYFLMTDCCICLMSLEKDIIELKCGHQYHRSCLETWMRVKQVCPLCNRV
jgi:hypothetical protein